MSIRKQVVPISDGVSPHIGYGISACDGDTEIAIRETSGVR